jgi:hypothetical protein
VVEQVLVARHDPAGDKDRDCERDEVVVVGVAHDRGSLGSCSCWMYARASDRMMRSSSGGVIRLWK